MSETKAKYTDSLESLAKDFGELQISEHPLMTEARRWYSLWVARHYVSTYAATQGEVPCLVDTAKRYEAFLKGESYRDD